MARACNTGSVSQGQGQQQPGPPRLQVIVPEAQSAGVYANAFATWFNQTDFTLDCLVNLPPQASPGEDERPLLVQPLQVVARVKFPPALIFRLIQNLNDAMTAYENQFGTIVPLGDPIPPPNDNLPPASQGPDPTT
jgi:hypothetical protein